MQLYESSLFLRSTAFLRFLVIRLFFRRVMIRRISYIGKRAKIFASRGGSITVNGKIHIRNDVELQAKNELIIGKNCGINSFSRIIAFELIRIGDNVSIAQFVSILDHDHNMEYKDGKIDFKKFTTQPVQIGSNVWIGDKVSINKGVKIGDNVIIGANSVVTHDIPSNSVAAGIPAEVIKEIIRK